MDKRSGRKAIWGWMMFDWASQPYNTLLLTFVFAPYFTSTVVADPVQGQATWGYMIAAAGLVIALLAPILGAIADTTGPRKPWISVFTFLYCIGAWTLWWATPEMDSTLFILVAFAVGLIGMEFSLIFTNAMLPDLGPRSELGRISGSGWAWGYVGGVLALFIMLLFLAENDQGVTLLGKAPLFGLDAVAREGTRSVGPLTAIWMAVFVIPLFLWVPDAPRKIRVPGAVERGLGELFQTIKGLGSNSSLAAYLVSSMFYRDALNGLYAFGGIYAAGVLGWSITQIGIFGIVAALSGALFAWLGGFADQRFGPKPVITLCILLLILVAVLVLGTSRQSFFGFPLADGSGLPDRLFYFCGVVIGAAGGVLQAASRTLLIHQANEDRMTEAFGLYALAGRATSFLAPISIAIMTDVTQNQRLGFLPIIVLFFIGLTFMFWVKPAKD